MNRKNVFTYLILFVFLCNQAEAQNKTRGITLKLQQTTLARVIEEVEKQTDHTFFINDSRIDVNKKVSVDVTNGTLAEVLDKTISVAGYNYSIVDKQILISLRPEANQTEREIKGTVFDPQGEPVIGATIQIKKTNSGTISDLDGNFTISVADDRAVLVISYLGYDTQEVTIGNRNRINIALAENTRLLEEVVIVGYGSQTKKTLTGAVSVVKFDEIESPAISSVSHALAGKAAGLRVNMQSAQPGGATLMRIRGEAAGAAGSEPLVVIDGFPVSSTGNLEGNKYTDGDPGSTDNILGSLSPDDIESITVLKDAASTAIYGARAGHGVILITTKRGKNQKAKVSYSGSASVQTIARNYDILDVQSYMDMRNKQAYENYLANYGLGIYSDYISTPETVPTFQPYYTNDQIYRAKGTNWLDEVTRTGFIHQHNVSVNGGTETTRYMASLNYMNQEGIVKENGASRMTGRLNIDMDLSKYVTAGITATYSQNKYDNVPLGDHSGEYAGVLGAAIRSNPFNPVYDENGDYYIDPARSFAPNAVSLLEYNDETVKDRLLATGFIVLKPIKGLEIKGQLGVDRRFQKRSIYIPKTTVEGARQNGAAKIMQQDATDYLMDFTATYHKELNGHNLKGLVGYAYQEYNHRGVTGSAKDFLTDSFKYNNLSAGGADYQNADSDAGLRSIASYFGRINYSYHNRYLVEATLRIDGSSNFEPENRWGYFPSVSLGWVISEEKFMQSVQDWLPYLKLRGSYGATGNENVRYGLQSTFGIGWSNAIIGNSESKGAVAQTLGNKDLTWETTTEFNIGLDMGFFNNRLSVTAEYFNRQVKDMLQSNKPIPLYNELTSIVANAGRTQSKGVEVTINSINLKTGKWEWNSTLTLAHYEDRWKERPSFADVKPYYSNSDAFKAWWSYEAIGIMQPGDEAPKAQKDLLPGMVIIKDQNNDGIIDDYDMIYQGSGSPKLIFGLDNNIKFGNFDFNIYFYGESGSRKGASYKEDWVNMDTSQLLNVSSQSFKSFNSNNLDSTHPTFLKHGSYGWGDYYVKNIYFIRCGNITLGYTLPVNKKLIHNMRVYANVSNPFVITNWTGLDPETDNGSYPYPNVRSFGLGLNITF